MSGYPDEPREPVYEENTPHRPEYPPYPPDPRYPQNLPYPPYPQENQYPPAGWPPVGAPELRDQPEPPYDPRFGKMGKPLWTFRQTLLGTAITLIPWVTFIVATSSTSGGVTTPSQTLPRSADVFSAIVVLVFTIIVEGAFLLAPAYFALRHRGVKTWRDGLRALGLRSTPFLPALGWVVLGIIVVYIVTILYGLAIDIFHLNLQTNADVLMKQATYAPITVIALLAGAVLVAPFCEEIFFRGFVFTGLVGGMTPWLAGLVSALLFGIAHGDVGSFVPLFVIGLVLAFVRWRTGSIWPGMALHAFNNALAAIAVLSVLMHP
jgi:membrane protease YdiL (CAAX protease family)